MKKLLLAAIIAATFVTSAFADPTKISYVALKNFSAEFRHASDVSWSATANYYKASSVFNNQRMESYYTPAGEKIGSSVGVSLDELPVKAKRAFAKKYGSYVVKEAILFEGVEENAYFINAENDSENVIVKVFDSGEVSVFKKTKK